MDTVIVVRSYAWDEGLGRYRDTVTGRVISRAQVRGMIEDSLAASMRQSETLANLVANGFIDSDAWRLAMREEMKKEYIRQYLLGVGGKGNMKPSDWGSIGRMLKEQYHYLDGFTDAVAAGDLTENQIRARAEMYLNSARESFERANSKAANRLGFDTVAWNLGTAAEHCGDCVSFAEMGYQPVDSDPFGGAFPGSGDTQCLTGCRCSLSYKKSDSGGTY